MNSARLPLATMLLASPVAISPAFAQAVEGAPVACPPGLQAQITEVEFQSAVASFLNQASDIVPDGERPARTALKKAARTPGFPRAGSAVAYLLLDEQGTVQRVVVTCATSAEMVAPIEAALRDVRPGRATRDGQPVKAAVYVQFELGG